MATKTATSRKTAATARRPTAKAPARKAAARKPAARPQAAPAPADAPGKKREKLVRDGFTIPKSEFAVLAALKQRIAGLGQAAKKSELLRAGIKVLAAMSDAALAAAVKAVPSIKTGRPAKSEKPAGGKKAAAKRAPKRAAKAA